MHLDALKAILKEKEIYLFPCIEDLVCNGISSTFFTQHAIRPCRQDATQYLAAWFVAIGVSAEECQPWMIKYCLEVFKPISSGSPSDIKHSTKSNIKFFYQAGAKFRCGIQDAAFVKRCPACMYNSPEMIKRREEEQLAKAQHEAEQKELILARPDGCQGRKGSSKEQYREQFEKAIDLIKEQIKTGARGGEILQQLNGGGYKTRTGKTWTYSLLRTEQRRLEKEGIPKSDAPAAAVTPQLSQTTDQQ